MRFTDLFISASGLLFTAPIVLAAVICVGRRPFYVGRRVGKDGRVFGMVKIRSMDERGQVTPVGRVLRRWKIDELPQFWNVLIGDMALVGPRPNEPDAVREYTAFERRTLSVKPGITDLASIVFADQDKILEQSVDKKRDYDALIRPYKSRLGVLYVERASPWLDLQILWVTAVALVDRKRGLRILQRVLKQIDCPEDLMRVARRDAPLVPARIAE